MGLPAATTTTPTAGTSGPASQSTPLRSTNTVSAQPSSSVPAEASTSLQPQSSLSAMANESSPLMAEQAHSVPRRRSVAESKGKSKEGDTDQTKLDQTRSPKQQFKEEPLRGSQQSTSRADPVQDGATSTNAVGPSPQTSKALAAQSASASVSMDNNQVIMAATVEKLVQKLTSEIDYTFLTDFFLIYRLFITPMELLNLFMLRFQWALVDDSPTRQIVRIRTFVTLRHWLLNYFGYDFMRSKALRQTLTQHLRSIAEHPIVMGSTRDQRIVRELRRYVQSLKKIHYRTLAQQKLERQSRKLGERQQCLYSRRASLQSHQEWPASPVSAKNDHPGTSRRSSVANPELMYRRSNHSEPVTEELSVEFRSSDQSEDDSNEEDEDDSEFEGSEDDDDFELSSENSVYESDYDSEESMPVDDSDRSNSDRELENYQPAQTVGFESESMENWRENVSGAALDVGSRTECHLPSPKLSPRSPKFKQGGTGSVRSQHARQSVPSSMASRPQARKIRPGLPDFTRVDRGSASNLNSPTTSFRQGAGRSRTNTHSQPMLTTYPTLTSPFQIGPPLSTIASVRSVEPYINPPPRSITTIEKKGTWSRYMSATVDRLSKVKNIFSQGSKRSQQHPRSPTSTLSFASKRTSSSAVSQARSTRYWQGSRSDPENDKFSSYFLGSCSGMNMLLSSSDDRHYPFNRRYVSERDHGREEVGNDWTSDDDHYSQYEMTRRSSRQLGRQDAHVEDEHEPVDPQLLEARLEQAQYPLYVDATQSAIRSGAQLTHHEEAIEDRRAHFEEHIDQQALREEVFVMARDVAGTTSHQQEQTYDQLPLSEPIEVNIEMSVAHPEHDSSHQYGKLPRRHSSDLLDNRDIASKFSVDQSVPPSPLTRKPWIIMETPIAIRPQDCTFAAPGESSNLAQSRSVTEAHSGPELHTLPTKLVQNTLNRGRSKSQPHLQRAASFEANEPDTLSTQHLTDHIQQTQSSKPLRNVLNMDSSSSKAPSLTRRATSNLMEIHQLRQGLQTSTSQSQLQSVDLPPLHPSERSSMPFVPKEPRVLPFVLRYRSELIAQQLCLVERELLCQIQWYELLDAGWTKKSTSTSSSSDKVSVVVERDGQERDSSNKRDSGGTNTASVSGVIAEAPNPRLKQRNTKREESAGIKRLVDRFNLTCQWVTSEIVRTQDFDMRVKVVEKFIRIAHTCYNHSNFSSLIQIMLGLQAHSVSRLSQTWARVRAQEMRIMHDLVEFTSPFHNWKHLRDAMKNIADEWGGNGGPGSGGTTTSLASSASVSEKPAGGVTLIAKSSSKSWIQEGSRAWRGSSRRPSVSQPPADSTIITPVPSSQAPSLFSNRQRGFSAPVLLSGPSSSTKSNKGKDKSRPQQESEVPKSGRQGGCIPFLGLYLADLVFNSELPSIIEPKVSTTLADPESQDATTMTATTTTTTTSSPLINIHKHRTTATIIKRVLTFRTMTTRYPFQPEPEVQGILMAIQGLDSAELLRLSYLCEERASDTVRG
ncbi:MAG: hypothetical protein J3Q66DRAFT_333268 [Benniella sp.]|nr:MAG: hypothetical protein J3Q66DRAFT_333268 [Benniella sp.]